MCLYELETTNRLSVLLFYDVCIDSGTTLKFSFSSACVFVNVEPYRPTVTVQTGTAGYVATVTIIIYIVAPAMHLAFYKSSIPQVHSTSPFHKSIPRVHSIPRSASYIHVVPPDCAEAHCFTQSYAYIAYSYCYV